MTVQQNIIGKQLRKLRKQKELTQEMLAARCGTLGWDVSENVITKIETQIRCVTDRELVVLSRALRVKVQELFGG